MLLHLNCRGSEPARAAAAAPLLLNLGIVKGLERCEKRAAIGPVLRQVNPFLGKCQ
jgi:hypothetical protein